MKLNLLVLIATSALPTLADTWQTQWYEIGGRGYLISTWYSSTNGPSGEPIDYNYMACKANPGPAGMEQFCTGDEYCKFLYAGQSWRCLKLTASYYKYPNNQSREGRETWSEVAGPC